MHIAAEQPGSGQRQQSQLQAGSETTRICDVARLAYFFTVHLGQAVHECPLPEHCARSQAEILAQVDHPHRSRNRSRFQELTGIAVTDAEENHIDARKIELSGETHIRIAQQIGVHVTEQIARIGVAVHEHQFHPVVIDENTDSFATRISRTSYNAYFNSLHAYTLKYRDDLPISFLC